MDSAARRKPALDAFYVMGVAQLEIFVANALAAGQQAVAELLRVEMHVTLDLLEPLHPVTRGALQFEGFDFAFLLVTLECASNIAPVMGEHAGESNRVLHREFRPGTDGKVGGVRSITDQHDVIVKPLLAQHALELQPYGRAPQMARVGNQREAVQTIGTRLLPDVLGRFDDERRPLLVEPIAVQVEPAPLGFCEIESERVQLLPGSKPDKAILAHLNVRLEDGLVFLPRDGKNAIRCDHKVISRGVGVRTGHFGLKN